MSDSLQKNKASNNGTGNSVAARPWATKYRERGLAICKPDSGTKNPTYKGWQLKSLEPDQFRGHDLIGIQGGRLSGDLVIVDLDSPDALAKADEYLPETEMIEGRPGKPRSHRYYRVTNIPAWAVSTAADGIGGPRIKHFTGFIDFIGTGGQAVCPPSVWTSEDGKKSERREWDSFLEPATVNFSRLWEDCRHLARRCGWKDKNTANKPRQWWIDKARKYIATMPSAIAEHGGHDRTFAVACRLLDTLQLAYVDAWELLLEYNARAEPPWTEKELRHKLDDAKEKVGENPGYVLAGGWYPLPAASTDGVAAAKVAPPVETPKKTGFIWKPKTSAEFDGEDYRPSYHVKKLIAKGQPGILCGPQKSLKTNILLDLFISMASGTPALGFFDVPQACKVVIISGESGPSALQNAARRICASKGITLASLGDQLLWQFRLPQLSVPEQLEALAVGLRRDKPKVVGLDPLYLSLLAGGDVEASNVFQTGPLLLHIAEVCEDIDCTLLLVHHTNRNGARKAEPLDLTDMAYSGTPEWCRQWLLLNRRETYRHGTGQHKLWMVAGGSVGHNGLYAVDIDEGVMDDNFDGRKWQVTVDHGTHERQNKAEEKAQYARIVKQAKDTTDGLRLIDEVKKLAAKLAGIAPFRQVRINAGFNPERMDYLVNQLEGKLKLTTAPKDVPEGIKPGSKVLKMVEDDD